MPISATEYTNPPDRSDEGHIYPSWQDESIQVWALPVAPTPKESGAHDEESLAEMRAIYDKTLNTFEELQAVEDESPEERESRYDRIRSAVLAFMFNSNWNFDTLVERHISEVAMPAAMFVRNHDTHSIEPYRGPMPGGVVPLPDMKVLTRTPWPGASVNALPPTKPAPESISYIIRTHKTRGTFDAKRGKELGVKPGPEFGKLSRGESVQNAKGETITPDMVMGPDKPGQGVAILDVPSVDYLESLVQRQEFQAENVMSGINACFWLLGPGVSGHPTLQQFMQKLNQMQHIVSSVDDCTNGLALESVAAQTMRLGHVDPARFHVPFFDNDTLPQNSLYGRESSGRAGPLENAVAVGRGLRFSLMPKFAKTADATPYDVDLVKNAKEEMHPDVLRSAEQARQAVHDDAEALHAWSQLLARPDTEIITLGTGSALPSKYRNVSATLLRVPGVGNYLFDCGENTLGQLQRVFNPEELTEVIRDLRVIWISHLHADHHLGTTSVIKAWYKIRHSRVPTDRQPDVESIASNVSTYGLSVVSHQHMIKWLREYSAIEDYGYSRILPIAIQPGERGAATGSKLMLTLSDKTFDDKIDEKFVLRPEDYETVFGLTDFQSCFVRHCFGAMAVSITFPRSPSDSKDVKPLKVSYSGDCRPSTNFARMGQDTTVLIHEATFDDELKGDAVAKKHSTTSEALDIGAQMDAKAVILTHFSQRYQKIPILETVRDGEQEDDLRKPDEIMEDVEQEGKEEDGDDGPADNVDAHSSAATVTTTAPNNALPLTHGQVIKVRSKDMKVGMAFDYMRVKIGEIAQMEKFNDALNKLLVQEEEEVDEDVTAGEQEVVINKNGKKTSGDEDGGGSEHKKFKITKYRG
jgi:ribonuclease Z